MSNTIGLLCGHNENCKGMRAFNGEYEWDFNKKLSILLHQMINYEQLVAVNVYYRKVGATYFDQVRDVVKQMKEDGVTSVIELHLNSFSSEVRGSEILVHKESPHIPAYTAFLDEYVAKAGEVFKDRGLNVQLGQVNRGVKKIHSASRGFIMLNELHTAGISGCIWEPAFCHYSNPGSIFVLEYVELYAKLLSCLISKHLSHLTLAE